jgi:hypothetical protein
VNYYLHEMYFKCRIFCHVLEVYKTIPICFQR